MRLLDLLPEHMNAGNVDPSSTLATLCGAIERYVDATVETHVAEAMKSYHDDQLRHTQAIINEELQK